MIDPATHAEACAREFAAGVEVGKRQVFESYERGEFPEGSRPWRCEKELMKARMELAIAQGWIALRERLIACAAGEVLTPDEAREILDGNDAHLESLQRGES